MVSAIIFSFPRINQKNQCRFRCHDEITERQQINLLNPNENKTQIERLVTISLSTVRGTLAQRLIDVLPISVVIAIVCRIDGRLLFIFSFRTFFVRFGIR